MLTFTTAPWTTTACALPLRDFQSRIVGEAGLCTLDWRCNQPLNEPGSYVTETIVLHPGA